MNHNFGLHLGITTHLEKIYGAPSFESWCDIKTKVKRGKKLGINYYPQSQMYLPMQQVKVRGFGNTANNYHGCWNKFILLKVVCGKRKEKENKAVQQVSLVHLMEMFNFPFLCVPLCPTRVESSWGREHFCNLRVPLRGHTFIFSVKGPVFGPVHSLNWLL